MDTFIEVIKELLSYTAWEMETPKAYGPLHLSFMLIGFAVSVLLAWRLCRIGERGNRILILSVGVFLLISEVYKQLLYELVLEPEPDYRWGNFPFQLCSIPMYLCLMLPFIKSDRIKRAMYSFLMTYNLLGGFIAFFEPSGLLHGHWTLTMHALIWHMLLVFLGVYIALSGRGCRDKSDYRDATVTFLILCLVAFSINCIFYELSQHKLNLFFLGPAHASIIVFKQISETFGWFVSTALYIPTVCLGAFIIYSFLRFLNKKLAVKLQTDTQKTA